MDGIPTICPQCGELLHTDADELAFLQAQPPYCGQDSEIVAYCDCGWILKHSSVNFANA